MNSRRYELPATRTLVAFEAAARLGSITRAAEESEPRQLHLDTETLKVVVDWS